MHYKMGSAGRGGVNFVAGAETLKRKRCGKEIIEENILPVGKNILGRTKPSGGYDKKI